MTEVQVRTIVFHLPVKAKAPVRRTKARARRLPRIARLMALAIRFDQLLRSGTVKDYADLARLGRVSRARITQIMNLLNLAPDIQESLLYLEPVECAYDALSERALRDVVHELGWDKQRKIFARLGNALAPRHRDDPWIGGTAPHYTCTGFNPNIDAIQVPKTALPR
jgi:hypothetical protein